MDTGLDLQPHLGQNHTHCQGLKVTHYLHSLNKTARLV